MAHKERSENIKKYIKEAIDDITSRQTSNQQCQNAKRIENIRRILEKSKTAKALLDWADKNDIRILFDDQLPPSNEAVYLQGTGIILLSTHSNEATSVSFLAHELRHAWQDSKKWFSFTNKLARTAYDLTMPLLLLEADAFAHQVQVSAELYLEGIKEPWEEIEGPSSQSNATYFHAFKNYQSSALKDVENIHNGRAMIECFKGWFESPAKQFYISIREEQIFNSLIDEFIYLNDENINISIKSEMPSAHKIDNNAYSHLYKTLHDNTSEGLDFRNKKAMSSLFETMDGGSYLVNELNNNYLQSNMFEINFSSDFSADFLRTQERHNTALKQYINHPIHDKTHKNNTPKF